MVFDITRFPIEGPILITPKVFADDRGYFFESYSKKDLHHAGIDCEFLQDNEAYSKKGTLRGIHFQHPPYAQSKLVRVAEGTVLDVAVDLRMSSPTYGQYIAVELTASRHELFFIPAGFGHGYLVTSDTAIFIYKCDQYYHPTAEGGVRYDDPQINIKWPDLHTPFQVSAKDSHLPLLRSLNHDW